ncbi:CDP-glucose 4,6-dehydratase [Brachyspira hampsonii]|uniref:CDP-glucose 4,6-dehydratase n=1 Tax=Brachyspira hampsonii TaxID=1287055 RepID=A0A1E5NID5_9SPIR|nr:CDP-glucose 4,6-dehydratase [Brachyspira hampsonii]OEJ15959.1 CDP-glucose 4,6-dehydratase [Brachyspira hampsonii]
METLGIKTIFEIFKNKNILITGHTGFKGAWLSKLLLEVGSNISGISLKANDLSLYNLLGLDNQLNSYILDIRDVDNIKKIVLDINPDIIFHLAAQPLVIDSYNNPLYTFETNVIGTINLMEAMRQLNNLECAVMITTDKVYDNKEWVWGYRENDSLGGHDPYSASKACSEIAIKSYKKSFFKDLNIVSVRAGNVIGGGDFADNRIIPDIVRAIEKNIPVELRNPNSVRPWQHVLDVLYGYLLLAYNIINKNDVSDSYNFAPIDEGNKFTVEYITKSFIDNIGKGSYKINIQDTDKKEMNMLRLDSSLARKELKWNERFSTEEAIKQTAIWYKEYLNNNDLNIITNKQIKEYIN